MKQQTKQLLEAIKNINEKNQELYDRKAKLEEEILLIDIELFKLIGEYNKITSKILKQNED